VDLGRVTISPLRAMGSVDVVAVRVSGVAWERSRQGPTTGTDAGDRTTTTRTTQNRHHTSDVPVTRSTTSPIDLRVAAASGESPAQMGRNGNPGVHPGAVQEADPRARVRAVESE
jgi:hypothetical protein